MLFLLPLFVFFLTRCSRWSVYMYDRSFCLFNLFLRLLSDFVSFFCYLFLLLMPFSVYFDLSSRRVFFFVVGSFYSFAFFWFKYLLRWISIWWELWTTCWDVSGKRQDIESTFTRGGKWYELGNVWNAFNDHWILKCNIGFFVFFF